MPKLLPTEYKTFLASQLYESLTESANTVFYLYTGVHGDVIGEIPTPADDIRQLTVDAYRNMIFGKRIDPDDVALVVRYIPYESNKVFAMYDDNDDDLLTKDFYCVVDEDSFLHTYKCLNNNFNAESTVEPSFAFVSIDNNYIINTSDGYVWKYIYSVSSSVKNKFTTQNYFPVANSANVVATAIPGSIDVIRIEQTDLEIPGGGKKYDNYVTGTFSAGQLRVDGNNFLYAISNTIISYQAGFYTGCMLYLSGGTGSGQHSLITDYFHNSNGNFITIERQFDIDPQNGTTFEIYPSVSIKGSGTESVTATARALVNSTGSNSIYRIEMLERGEGYDYISANVVASGTVVADEAFVAAELHPIYSPDAGHGAEPSSELGADAIEFSVKLANSESNTILVNNRYQQVGILTNPLFSNVLIATTNTAGVFHVNEKIYKIDPLRINSNVNISNTSNVITGQTSTLLTAAIVTSGTGGNYLPTDILTIQGGVPIDVAQVKVIQTNVRTATVNAIGSGYTPGTFTANLNLGTAVTNATFTVTANTLGQCNSVVINNPGHFTSNPPFLANSTPIGGSPGSGLTLNITMGLDTLEIAREGAYALIPTALSNNMPVSNVGTGTGATLLLTFETTLTADFLDQLAVSDYVYLTNFEKNQQQLAVVGSISNATNMTITTNGFFACTQAMMYLPRISASADILKAANSTHIVIANVNEQLITGDLVVGEDSGAKAQVSTISRNGVAKNFNSFIELYKYEVTALSDEFIENEFIYQGNSFQDATATALVHSVENLGGAARLLYTSNQVGQFDTAEYVQGVNSFAVASIQESFSPEVNFGSGDVIYIENIEPVERMADQAETFQIILTFSGENQ